MQTLSALNIPVRTTDPPVPQNGTEIYSKNGIVYSIDSSGIIQTLTNIAEGGTGAGNDNLEVHLHAAVPILANKVIRSNPDGQAIYASSFNSGDANRIIGISKNAASVGQKVVIRVSGYFINTGWNWTPNQLLYLGENGDVVSNPNTGVLSNSIGYAITPTTIFINIGRSIIRG